MKDLFQLFKEFFKIGLFTFGGGLAMLPLIQKAAVEDYKWVTEEEMVDCVALAQSLPGVIAINSATYIGYKKSGFLGAVFATMGVALPAFISIVLAIVFLEAIGDNKYIDGSLVGIKAASFALILYAAWSIGKQIVKGRFELIIALAAFFLIVLLDVNAILIILGAAALGLISFMIRKKKAQKGEETQHGDL